MFIRHMLRDVTLLVSLNKTTAFWMHDLTKDRLCRWALSVCKHRLVSKCVISYDSHIQCYFKSTWQSDVLPVSLSSWCSSKDQEKCLIH